MECFYLNDKRATDGVHPGYKWHDMNIFHRDLKSANIFLNKDGTAKLGDLNVSKLAKRGLLYT